MMEYCSYLVAPLLLPSNSRLFYVDVCFFFISKGRAERIMNISRHTFLQFFFCL